MEGKRQSTFMLAIWRNRERLKDINTKGQRKTEKDKKTKAQRASYIQRHIKEDSISKKLAE